jgi:hypothetical protein
MNRILVLTVVLGIMGLEAGLPNALGDARAFPHAQAGERAVQTSPSPPPPAERAEPAVVRWLASVIGRPRAQIAN